MKRMLGLVTLVALCCSFAASQTSTEDEMFGYVVGIEGKSHTERGEFIKEQLSKLGLGYFTIPFDYVTTRGKDTLDLSGEDIVVRVGSGTKRVVVGAHYDAAEGSPGANDNGSGVAVLLELIKSMGNSTWKCTVDFVFFDREETGLLGSQFYIQRVVNRSSHYGMINLDVEGMGDEVFVGPVGGGDDSFLMPLVRKAARQTKFAYKEEDVYPASDYAAFESAQLENISVSVVPKGDPELLVRMLRSGGKIDPKYMPQVMTVMHTPDDRSDKVSPHSLEISYEFTRTVLQLIDGTIRER
jgi:hypothetical protein